MKKYDNKYKKMCLSVPEDVAENCKKYMSLIGCNNMTTFVSLALIDYVKKIKEEYSVVNCFKEE